MLDTTEQAIVAQPLPGPQPLPSAPAPPAVPIAPSQRVAAIDMLRGFAIFGILLVNMALFTNSFYAQIIGLGAPTGMLDQLARWGVAFFAEGKFYSIFAFLFGLGLAIQQRRFAAAGRPFVPFYLRRLGVLLLIGMVHAYLFWVGDILILYALLGTVLLLLFRNRRPRTLLIWAGIALLIPLALNAALFGLLALARLAPDSAALIDRALAEQTEQYRAIAAAADQIYASGSFAEITRQRVRDMNFVYGTWPFIAFNVLAMLLLGLAAGRWQIFEHIAERLPLIRRIWLWGLIVGVLGNLLYVVAGESAQRSVPSPQLLASLIGQTIGAPALSLFYMCSLVLLSQHLPWQRWLRPLENVGRMAISNYLLQTVICTTLFYGYGLGLYGQIDEATGVLLTVVIYALQIPLSAWWLRRFRFGPVEWLWRSLSYGRRQPMRLVGLLLAMLGLAACGLLGTQAVRLREQDAGRTIELRQGDRLDIVLGGNPTTGYQWEQTAGAPAILRPAGAPTFTPDSQAVGAGGSVTLPFEAAGAGETTLTLIYHRSFEPAVPPLQTFTVTIRVT